MNKHATLFAGARLAQIRILFVAQAAVLALFSFQASADAGQAFKSVDNGVYSSIKEHMDPDKWTVVMIWSTSCHVCNDEAPKYSAFHSKHAGKDAKIIGLSLDGTPDDAQGFVKRHGLNYPNLVGNVRDVAMMYQSESGESFRATPTFMVFSPNGELKAAQAGGVPPEVIEEFISQPTS